MGHSFPGGQCPIRPATWCPRRHLSHGGRPRRQSVLSLRVPLATSGGGTAVIVPFLRQGSGAGRGRAAGATSPGKGCAQGFGCTCLRLAAPCPCGVEVGGPSLGRDTQGSFLVQ